MKSNPFLTLGITTILVAGWLASLDVVISVPAFGLGKDVILGMRLCGIMLFLPLSAIWSGKIYEQKEANLWVISWLAFFPIVQSMFTIPLYLNIIIFAATIMLLGLVWQYAKQYFILASISLSSALFVGYRLLHNRYPVSPGFLNDAIPWQEGMLLMGAIVVGAFLYLVFAKRKVRDWNG